MSLINDRLRQLYEQHHAGINELFSWGNRERAYLDGPHLAHCWENYYAQSKFKIFFLGQENYGWTGLSDDIDGQVAMARDFEHAKDYQHRSSPFWRAVHALNAQLNKDTAHQLGFVASNVCKYCDVERGPISDDDKKTVIQYLNLLPGELKILQPDVVIFFCGYKYDPYIQLQLGDQPIVAEQVVASIPAKELARIQHPDLPKHSYRTYHPNYLRYSGKWNYIGLIGAAITGHSIDAALLAYQRLMKELAVELGLLQDEPENVLNIYEGFYFYRPEWRWCGIGFEFEGNGAGSFFYGICRKDSTVPVPAAVQEILKEKLSPGDGSTEHWPWWRWSEHKNWNDQTIIEINTGEMEKKIRMIILDLLTRLEGASI